MASRSLMPFSRNMPMSRWSEDMDPFLAMRREVNRLFDDAFSGFGLPSFIGPALRQMPAAPKIDVSETDNEIHVTAEMPGIDQNDVEVLLEDDRLIIRGEKSEEREDEDKNRNYHIRERVQGAFSRTLPLPFAPDPSQVKAEFKDGVMTITIPKPQEVKQKQHRIEVQKDTSAPSEPSVSRSGRQSETTSSTTSQSQAEQREKETAAG
ncbi:MAG: Hsp20/alpha crystallin family protein [Stellaceae bacterium]